MVDLDKFICSLLVKTWDFKSIGIRDIKVALKDQGLEYKDGAIKPIEKEGKPVIIDAGFGSLTVHFNEEEMEAFKEGLKKKPETVKPKFNVGQTIRKEDFNDGFTISKIEDGFYYNTVGDYFPFTDQDNWELVKPSTIKFNEPDIDNKMPLKESKQANHAISSYHPRKFHPQTQGVLRLDKGNQSIVVERLLIELVEYIRSGISGLEESKVLPFLDSLQKSLEEQEKQHWTHVLGFPVPEGMKFFQVP